MRAKRLAKPSRTVASRPELSFQLASIAIQRGKGWLVYVIAWARGQLRINFTSIFKVLTKLPESRSDEGNLENFENTSEINP